MNYKAIALELLEESFMGNEKNINTLIEMGFLKEKLDRLNAMEIINFSEEEIEQFFLNALKLEEELRVNYDLGFRLDSIKEQMRIEKDNLKFSISNLISKIKKMFSSKLQFKTELELTYDEIRKEYIISNDNVREYKDILSNYEDFLKYPNGEMDSFVQYIDGTLKYNSEFKITDENTMEYFTERLIRYNNQSSAFLNHQRKEDISILELRINDKREKLDPKYENIDINFVRAVLTELQSNKHTGDLKYSKTLDSEN